MSRKKQPISGQSLSEVKEQFKTWRRTRKNLRPIPKKLWAAAVNLTAKHHFHLLVKMIPEHRFTDKETQGRVEAFYSDSRGFSEGQLPYFREKLSSLSEFKREIKVGLARYYNRRHNRRGYFWGDHFKCVIVDKGETLINCLAYIDLNPFRAGLVDRPEDYRWNSLGYHLQTDNKDQFLSTDSGLKEFSNSIGRRLIT